MGPIAAPCSFPLRGFSSRSSSVPCRPIGGQQGSGDGPPSRRIPWPQTAGPLIPLFWSWPGSSQREGSDRTFLDCRSAHCRQFCQSNRPSLQPGCRAGLPGQQRRSLTKQLDHRPGFPRQVPPLNPSRFASPMHGSCFCGSSELLTSSADWVTVSSFQHWVSSSQVSCSVNQSISQSFSQSMARQAEDLSFLVSFLSLCPRFDFLGVLLVHVPRFSSTRDLDASAHMDMALPASERSIGWPPWPQRHSAISISFRLDQTKTRPASCSIRPGSQVVSLPCLQVLNAVIRGASR